MTPPPYVALAVAIVCEVIGTLALKASDGFTRLPFTAVMIVAYGIALYLLTLVMKTMPVGVAYAIWTGAGVALIVCASAVVFRQIPDPPALLGIVLIGAGVATIRLFSKTPMA